MHKLGVAHAKPQAIRRLMGCDGEENNARPQNIKSHPKKYRLFFSSGWGAAAPRAAAAATTASQPLDPYLERQHNGLLAQPAARELHTQLLIQRSTQAALSLRMSHSQGRPALHPLQLQRLARVRCSGTCCSTPSPSSTVDRRGPRQRGVPPASRRWPAGALPLALGVGAQGGAPRGGAFGDASASGGAGGLGALLTCTIPTRRAALPPTPNAFVVPNRPRVGPNPPLPPAQQFDRFDVDPVPSTAEALPGEGLLTADFLPEVLPEEEDDGAGCLE